jgi:hypothetical protein
MDLAIMSAKKENTTAKNIIKQMPANLRQHLRDANIQPADENSVAKRLKERLSANIISYLQLTVLKINHGPSQNQQMQLHEKQRSEYATHLSERIANENEG